ncbi:MAG: class I SAM-dependent methyltransferase [Niastella sp.]|nr:class I SAM-dependent methyltransferase [Niastella sp.]
MSLFCKLAVDKGFDVTGLDATPELIAEAKKRASGKNFIVGEMEQLPFEENYFDIVCGFNSFQYATDFKKCTERSKRVLKDGGKLSVMIWEIKEDCEGCNIFKSSG